MQVELRRLPVQKEFMEATEDFVAIVSSRSCGKSWASMLCDLTDMMQGKNVIYCAQTDGAFYKGPWKHLQDFLVKFNLRNRWSWNSTYKTGTLDLGGGGQSRMFMGSYTNECNEVRGATEISALYLDEFCLSDPGVLACLTPCMRGHDNYGNLIDRIKIRAVSTPNMESLWQVMLVEHEKHGIRLLRAKLSDMPDDMVPQAVKDSYAKSIFDPKMRAQEIDGEIIIDGGQTAVMNLSDFTNRIQPFHDDGVYAGLDMAHKGQRDSHVFCAVQGNRLLALHEFGKCDHMEVATWVKKFNAVHRIKMLSIDLAWSELVYEQLRYSIPSTQVSFAEKPPEEDEKALRQYANIRAYGYFRMGQHTRDGLVWDVDGEFIDNDIVSELKREVCNTHFLLDRMGRILIEPKEDIKIRLGRSPDVGDAAMLACLSRPGLMSPTLKAHQEVEESKYREDLEQVMSED